jgi:hypothetical protein
LIEGAYERTKKLLMENKDKLTKLATVLMEKEVIFKEDLEEIFGKRAYVSEREALESVKPDIKPEPNGVPKEVEIPKEGETSKEEEKPVASIANSDTREEPAN